MGKVIETTFRVRYAETDASGVVYHSHYIVWFELGRGEWFWQQGRDYHRDVEERGLNWPVVELSARYIAPARYGDLVTVRTRAKEIKSREFTLAYQVHKAETGELLCEGWTKHLNLNQQWQVCAIPKDIRELLQTE
ncbi:MAG: acyl-CoA thioesterase [Chloroflexi bacterium]|nr:acyl-CoA thioesterase [Chloroflexota bacterium]